MFTEYLIEFTGAVFELYIAFMFFGSLGRKRFKNIILWPAGAALEMVHALINRLFFGNYLIRLISLAVTVILLCLCFRMKPMPRIFAAVFIFVIVYASELAVISLATSILKANIVYIYGSFTLYTVCLLSSKFLAFAVVRLLEYKEKQGKNWLSFSLAYKTLPLLLASFVTLILLFRACYTIPGSLFQIGTLTASLLLIAANIFVFYIIDRQNDYAETKQRLKFFDNNLKNQMSHYEELYAYQNELRRFKHDIKNRDLALMGLMEAGRNDEAISELQSGIDLIERQNRELVFTKDPVIDAVIRVKVLAAASKNINLKTKIHIETEITTDALEIGVMIGSALDNAIEACDALDSAEKEIILEINAINSLLSIAIGNPVKENVNVHDLRTTKSDKHSHGFGLSTIRSLAEKHSGEVNVSCENNRFEIMILLKQ